jgi:hypothetical protein
MLHLRVTTALLVILARCGLRPRSVTLFVPRQTFGGLVQQPQTNRQTITISTGPGSTRAKIREDRLCAHDHDGQDTNDKSPFQNEHQRGRPVRQWIVGRRIIQKYQNHRLSCDTTKDITYRDTYVVAQRSGHRDCNFGRLVTKARMMRPPSACPGQSARTGCRSCSRVEYPTHKRCRAENAAESDQWKGIEHRILQGQRYCTCCSGHAAKTVSRECDCDYISSKNSVITRTSSTIRAVIYPKP